MITIKLHIDRDSAEYHALVEHLHSERIVFEEVHTALRLSDRIIWDSGFGYELGYFLAEAVIGNTALVDIVTGNVTGRVSYPRYEIKPYSESLTEELTGRYGYKREWLV